MLAVLFKYRNGKGEIVPYVLFVFIIFYSLYVSFVSFQFYGSHKMY